MKTCNMSNYLEKKIFSNRVYSHILPKIYIDEYWDYYIKEYELEEKWDKFIHLFQNSNFDYTSFINELDKVAKCGSEFIYNRLCDNDVLKKYNDLMENSKPQMKPYDKFDLCDGEYLYVDIHNGFDTCLKHIDVYNENLLGVSDVIKKITDYEIFYSFKNLKMSVYNCLPNDKRAQLYNLENNVILENIYSSNHPIIKYINENFELSGKSGGDSYLYKIEQNKNVNDLLCDYNYSDIPCDYNYNDIPFHIEKLITKQITMFNEVYKMWIIKDKQDKIINMALYNKFENVSLSLYPFAYKLAMGEELNEKDLAVGYEDQIFFHWDKSEI